MKSKKLLHRLILIIVVIISIPFLFSELYLWSENNNFEKLRQKSELNCDYLPVHCAVKENNTEKFNSLITGTQYFESKNGWGKTALHYAADFENDEFFLKLLEAGANPNAKDENGETLFAYLLRLKKFDLAEKLVEKNVSVDTLYTMYNNETTTALHYAVMNNETEAVEFLLKHKARIDIKDSYGYTVTDRVKIQNHINTEIVEMILNYKIIED